MFCKIIEDTSAPTINRFVRKMVSEEVNLVVTDSAAAYEWLRIDYRHEKVDHKSGEYVLGEIHTNNIESFWTLLKRGVMGVSTMSVVNICRSVWLNFNLGITAAAKPIFSVWR